jgi:hypothetical protein
MCDCGYASNLENALYRVVGATGKSLYRRAFAALLSIDTSPVDETSSAPLFFKTSFASLISSEVSQ